MSEQRYTHAGDDEAERAARDAIDAVRSAIVSALPGSSIRSLLLVGGYGRGEGGVLRDLQGARLHNNLDLLLVVRGPWYVLRRQLQRRADEAVAPIARRLGVGVDIGVLSDIQLRTARCRVFYYDLQHGHRTLAGDPTFAPGLRFRVDALDPEDVLALVTNRGTLLAINEELLDLGVDVRRTVVKHAMKAILGHGDGWLWTQGLYHWSYAEKRRRMASSSAPRDLVRAYERAAALRFSPEPDAYAGVDLVAWNRSLIEMLEPVHRAVIHEVDGQFSSWHDSVWRGGSRWRRWLRSGPSLPRLYPLVAYGGTSDEITRAAASLGARATDRAGLRRSYLHAWGAYGDPNFTNAAAAMGLPVGVTP